MILSILPVKKCSKPNCPHATAVIHRHHKGCEAMWLRHFKHKKRTKTFKEFRERYYKYLDTDCVRICSWHHAEIHQIYIKIIASCVQERGMVRCALWSWSEARQLMSTLRDECDSWLNKVTPGIDPNKKKGVSQ